MTNKEKILEYLREHGEATIRELTINLWIQTPQEYIRQLREEGHEIKTLSLKGKKHGVYKYTDVSIDDSGQFGF